MPQLLEVEGLTAGYGNVDVLHGIDLTVGAGEKVVLLGPNGAGKTTLLKAVSRTVRNAGSVTFDGHSLRRREASAVARLGVGHVPAGRGTFVDLTVLENLQLGQLGRRRAAAKDRAADLDLVLETFPILDEFRARTAGQLSGGQQQMLALGRALLARPKLLLVDEPSLGLAPLVVRDLFASLLSLQSRWGLSLLLAEQNARLSLGLADRAYVLAGGRVVLTGTADQISTEQLHAAYLGAHVAGATGPLARGVEMTELIQLLVGGLATGSVYAALALSVSVIYSGTGILNFAQGQQAVVSAFLALTLVEHGWSVWLALPVVVVLSAALGAAIEVVLVRPVEHASVLARFTVTAALLIGINGLVGVIWDNEQHAFATPFGDGAVSLGTVTLTAQQLGSTLVVVAVMGAVALFFGYTDLGLAMRAVALNRESAALLGIRTGAMLALGWALAAAVGAVAGVMAAPTLAVSTDMMNGPLLLALAACALGGFGSRIGALAGGLSIGVLDAMASRYIPALGGDLSIALPFVVIWVVLMLRPHGLFGRASAVRA